MIIFRIHNSEDQRNQFYIDTWKFGFVVFSPNKGIDNYPRIIDITDFDTPTRINEYMIVSWKDTDQVESFTSFLKEQSYFVELEQLT